MEIVFPSNLMWLLYKGQRNSCILDSLSHTHPHTLIPQRRPQETPNTRHTLEQTHKQVCGYKWARLSTSIPPQPPFAHSHVFHNTRYARNDWPTRKNGKIVAWIIKTVSAVLYNFLPCRGLSGNDVGLATSCLWWPLLIFFTLLF